MAQKTTVVLIDDLDGGEAEESVSFGLDGIEYSIDLSGVNAKRLRDSLDSFVSSARRVGGRKGVHIGTPRTRPASAPSGRGKLQNTAIREWANQQGVKVSDRGRIPAEVIAAFDAAHAG